MTNSEGIVRNATLNTDLRRKCDVAIDTKSTVAGHQRERSEWVLRLVRT